MRGARPQARGFWYREGQRSAETESRATKVCRTTRKIGRNCGCGEIPSRLSPGTDLVGPKGVKTPRFGARPSGNRPEICVGWLSKHPESKTCLVKKKLYPRSHTSVSFDGNLRGVSTDFSCHPASKPGRIVGTFRAKRGQFHGQPKRNLVASVNSGHFSGRPARLRGSRIRLG